MPFQLDPNTSDQGHYFQSAGRLKAGVSLEQAQARLNASAADFKAKFKNGLGPNQTFGVEPVGDGPGPQRPPVAVRAGRRRRLRPADRLRECRQPVAGPRDRAQARDRDPRRARRLARPHHQPGAHRKPRAVGRSAARSGSPFGTLAIRALLSVNTAGLPRIGQEGALVGVDWRVLAFTTALSLATGLIFGLIPALQSSKTDLTSTLKETGGRSGTGFRQNKTRSILVVIEVALALTLLVGSALLIRSAIALGRVDPGFDANNVLTMRMSVTGPQYRLVAGGGLDGSQRHRSPEGAAGRVAASRHVLRAARRAATACRSSSSAGR